MLGAIVFTLALALLPGDVPVDPKGRIDWTGAYIGVASLLLFNFVWKSVDPVPRRLAQRDTALMPGKQSGTRCRMADPVHLCPPRRRHHPRRRLHHLESKVRLFSDPPLRHLEGAFLWFDVGTSLLFFHVPRHLPLVPFSFQLENPELLPHPGRGILPTALYRGHWRSLFLCLAGRTYPSPVHHRNRQLGASHCQHIASGDTSISRHTGPCCSRASP